ncbi:MAG: hypothetical protein EPO40_18120 [Myxococcaceae bacterium]|nr:MAG: hypothetical protein EPO40_18120 [Myxococcaceae bacterium]
MEPILVDVLCRRASSVIDVAARVQLFRGILVITERDELRATLDRLAERAGLRDTHAQVALLTAEIALCWEPDLQRAVHGDRLDVPASALDPDDERLIPDYGRGRVLTLGERKSLARRPDRKLIDRVLRDPHPDVIELLLMNPRLTEPDVVRLCARRPNAPDILLRVFRSPRWAIHPKVRTALALNPSTPPAIAEAVVPLLAPEDLHILAQDQHAALAVRRRCLEVLSRFAPLHDDPDRAVH